MLKTRRLFFLFVIFMGVVHLAATSIDPSLQQRITAFKKKGVDRKIDTTRYNKEEVIVYAESLLGVRHQMGGCSPKGVDCSGLVKLAHAQSGVMLPHSSHEQARYGTILSADEELKRGDLVFFHSTYDTPHLVTHSGIYLGDNKFIHTSNSNGVSVSTLGDTGYWKEHYLFATRLH